MANRKRNIQMKFYVTEEEKRLIDEKMAQLPTRRYGAYLRKMAIDGYIIQLDTTDIKRMNAALSAIGRNINQIAKRVNAGGGTYKADMREIQERLDEICLNVANSVTYLSQDFKLQGGKVGNGGSHFNGQRIVGRSVFVEGTGDLIKVAADFSVFGYQLSNSGQQFIIDRGNGNNGANGRPCNGLSDKLGLAHVIIL